MRLIGIGNRKLFRLALYALPSVCIVDGLLVEPEWIAIREIDLGGARPTRRLVHFSDLHYRGNRAFLRGVVDRINALDPDLVCFTGDIVEEREHLGEALDILKKIVSPLYGVPGNHDYWSGAQFEEIAKAFEATGGAWLVDAETTSTDRELMIVGASRHYADLIRERKRGRRILLTHYPAFADMLGGRKFDLILAGHSHGGQIRIPFWGAIALPWGSGRYEMGLYQTRAGPLYVNPGIGTFYLPVRLFCRPEITLIHL